MYNKSLNLAAQVCIKIAKLYEISKLTLDSTSIGNPPIVYYVLSERAPHDFYNARKSRRFKIVFHHIYIDADQGVDGPNIRGSFAGHAPVVHKHASNLRGISKNHTI